MTKSLGGIGAEVYAPPSRVFHPRQPESKAHITHPHKTASELAEMFGGGTRDLENWTDGGCLGYVHKRLLS